MSEAMNQTRSETPPKVSIGMPVFNGELFIRDAIDSFLAQTFTDFELIISDNGSRDGTEAICRECAARDARIRYSRQHDNGGMYFNFQFLLDAARGEYFMWAAADDVWDLKYIESLHTVSSRHQCIAYGFVQTIDAIGNKTTHPANCRNLEFKGDRFFRRLKYYMEPGVLGKANLIGALFPIRTLREIPLSSVLSEKRGADMIFLYMFLDRIEIRNAGGVFHYKRSYDDIRDRGVTQEPDKPNIPARFMACLKELVHAPMLGRYIKRSSAIESVIMTAIYPICVARHTVHLINGEIRSISRYIFMKLHYGEIH